MGARPPQLLIESESQETKLQGQRQAPVSPIEQQELYSVYYTYVFLKWWYIVVCYSLWAFRRVCVVQQKLWIESTMYIVGGFI